jgi:RHS repeat-associated protein
MDFQNKQHLSIGPGTVSEHGFNIDEIAWLSSGLMVSLQPSSATGRAEDSQNGVGMRANIRWVVGVSVVGLLGSVLTSLPTSAQTISPTSSNATTTVTTSTSTTTSIAGTTPTVPPTTSSTSVTGTVSTSTSTSTSTLVSTTRPASTVEASTSSSTTVPKATAAASLTTVPVGCQFGATSNGTLGLDGWITANGSGPVAQLTGSCVVGRIQIEVDGLTNAAPLFQGVGLLGFGAQSISYHRNWQTGPNSLGQGVSYPVPCVSGNPTAVVGGTSTPYVLGQPSALTLDADYSAQTYRVNIGGTPFVLPVPGLPSGAVVTPTTPIDLLPSGCWAGPSFAPAGARVRLVSASVGLAPVPPAVPTGCQFAPTTNGVLGSDGWVTSNGGAVVAQLTGTCSVDRVDIEIDSMAYAPANGIYNSVGLIEAGATNLSLHRNSQLPPDAALGRNVSYPTECQNGARSGSLVPGDVSLGFGQPTTLKATLNFATHQISAEANGFKPAVSDLAIPSAFLVTPTTPLNFFPTSCWAGATNAPSGSRLRLVGVNLSSLKLASVYGGMTSAERSTQTTGLTQTVSDPVNTATGAFSHLVSDVAVPGRGVSFELERSYDSRAAGGGLTGPFGAGWGWNLSESMVAGTGAVTWKSGAGQELVFAQNGASYISPPGTIAQLVTVSGGGWSLVRADQVTSTFDASGRLVSRKDRSGQGLAFGYATTGKLSTVTDAAGRITTFAYGTTGVSNGLLTQVKTADLRTVKYAYTAVGGVNRLTSVTDPRAKVTTLSYTTVAPVGLLASEVDPLSHAQFVNVYDASGRVVSQTDPTGAVSTFVWNDTTGEMTMTDATGAVTKHQYNSFAFGGATTPSGTTTVERDARLFPTKFTDGLGKAWQATYDDRGNMLSRRSPLGFVESWSYDGFNNALTHVDARGNSTILTYDTAGRQLTEARPLGVNLAWSWNPDGTLASSTDPRGGVSLFTYDANGLLATSKTPMGFVTSYTYDTAGRVLTVTEPRGNVAGAVTANFVHKYTYDAAGNVLTDTDALGRKTTNVYDNAGNKTMSTAPDGGVTTYGYNNANELVTMTAPDGGVTTFEYDNRGLKAKETSPIGAITTFFYDPSGRLDRRVDPRGNAAGGVAGQFTTMYTYDAENRTKTVTDPTGRVTTYTYDDQGRRLSEVRPDGTTTTVYDANSNVVSTSTESGTRSSTFDALNRVDTSTDARGKITQFGFDLASNQVSVIDPLLRKTTFTYDPDGRRTAMVDPRGYAPGAVATDFDTLYTYDAAGNELTVTDPLNHVVTNTYDRVGNRATTVNMNGQTTTYAYDTVNRVAKVTAPVVGATSFTYSTMGYLKTRTNPLLKVSSWEYDVGGRKVKEIDPLGRFFTFGYDIGGNQISVTDANANAAANPALGSTTLTYDSLNRVTGRTYSDGTPAVAYTYDGQGRRDSMTDATGTTTYTFDAADRVQTVTRGADTFTYVYDNNGNVTSRTYPDGTVVTAGFDDGGQMVGVTDPGGAVQFVYDPDGNPITTVFPNGVTRATVFDGASRVAEVKNTAGTVVLSKFNYTRDNNGNPTSIDYTNSTGLSLTESQRLTYDTADRLTKVCYTTTACAAANTTTWTYDKNGNRLTEKIGSAAISTYTYDAADQLGGITGAGAKTFTYNPNGDQLTAGTDTFTYNTARQTTGSTVTGTQRTFTYDGNNNRSTTSTAGAVAVAELWDTVGGLPNLAVERNATGVVQRRYTYGRGTETLRYQDVAAGTAGWYQTDALGSVANITNTTGAATATYTYSPFGTARLNTQTAGYAGNPLKYTGQKLDPTGTYNLRARQYNPSLGRFTQTDAMPMGAGSSFEAAYVYVGSNPVTYLDTSGLRRMRKDGSKTKTPTKPKDQKAKDKNGPKPGPDIAVPKRPNKESFFHGTLVREASSVLQGINLNAASPNSTSDFGPGFYTTRYPDQAQTRALAKAARQSPAQKQEKGVSQPVIVVFFVDYEVILSLNWLIVDNSSAPEVFRSVQTNGSRPAADVIEGPLLQNPARFRDGGPPDLGGNQQAWITPVAATALNGSQKALLPVYTRG